MLSSFAGRLGKRRARGRPPPRWEEAIENTASSYKTLLETAKDATRKKRKLKSELLKFDKRFDKRARSAARTVGDII